MKHTLTSLFLFFSVLLFSQEDLYTSFTIPEDLKQNANAVIRYSSINIELKSWDNMEVTEKRVITVLNEGGNRNIDAYVGYDNTTKIKDLEVLVFNNFGQEIKKIRKNDFKDVSAVSGGTLYSDSRVKYLEYTPISYPYTIAYTSVVSTSNTAFIQSFMPLDSYYLSVEKSRYTITHPEHLIIRKKEKHLQGLNIEKEESPGKLSYLVKNIKPIKPESYSPLFRNIVPRVLVALNEFSLEGVASKVENWNDFGKWMYHDLIKHTHDLPASTTSMIQDLVKDEPNDIEKAKKIYQYVQDKTRYISVQVGIGGWKPFNASEVDRLGYGDCKGLTNYTMALLKAAGVKSNYTVVYAGKSQRSLEKDFAAMQGNHVILNIPTEDDNIWLECTSQKLPFGFIGDFTDDRDVLVITPEGGEIKHTKKYHVNESSQIISGKYKVSNEGAINAEVQVNSGGIQYDDKYWLETEAQRDLDKHYKKRWRYINGLSISGMDIENDKTNIEFVERVTFEAPNYTKMVGDRMLLTVNAFNRNTHVPDRYRNRKFPLKVKRGFKDRIAQYFNTD